MVLWSPVPTDRIDWCCHLLRIRFAIAMCSLGSPISRHDEPAMRSLPGLSVLPSTSSSCIRELYPPASENQIRSDHQTRIRDILNIDFKAPPRGIYSWNVDKSQFASGHPYPEKNDQTSPGTNQLPCSIISSHPIPNPLFIHGSYWNGQVGATW